MPCSVHTRIQTIQSLLAKKLSFYFLANQIKAPRWLVPKPDVAKIALFGKSSLSEDQGGLISSVTDSLIKKGTIFGKCGTIGIRPVPVKSAFLRRFVDQIRLLFALQSLTLFHYLRNHFSLSINFFHQSIIPNTHQIPRRTSPEQFRNGP